MIAPFKFQLYLLWFRVLRFARAWTRSLPRHTRFAARHLPGLLRLLYTLLLVPVWLSFEGSILAWTRLEQAVQASARAPLRGWHRALYCIGVSVSLVQACCLVSGQGAGGWSLLLAMGYGLVVHLLWKRGARWWRHVLGVRPLIPVDPTNAYETLDFGN